MPETGRSCSIRYCKRIRANHVGRSIESNGYVLGCRVSFPAGKRKILTRPKWGIDKLALGIRGLPQLVVGQRTTVEPCSRLKGRHPGYSNGCSILVQHLICNSGEDSIILRSRAIRACCCCGNYTEVLWNPGRYLCLCVKFAVVASPVVGVAFIKGRNVVIVFP